MEIAEHYLIFIYSFIHLFIHSFFIVINLFYLFIFISSFHYELIHMAETFD